MLNGVQQWEQPGRRWTGFCVKRSCSFGGKRNKPEQACLQKNVLWFQVAMCDRHVAEQRENLEKARLDPHVPMLERMVGRAQEGRASFVGISTIPGLHEGTYLKELLAEVSYKRGRKANAAVLLQQL